MNDLERSAYHERPAVYVCLGPEMDPDTYRWVEIGAEEEGVPCRLVPGTATDPVALAYGAAQGSRLGVGIGLAAGEVVLQEAHMPADRAVLTFELSGTLRRLCRLMGGNAGRMVKHVPLRLGFDALLATVAPAGAMPTGAMPARGALTDQAELKQSTVGRELLARAIAGALRERGLA